MRTLLALFLLWSCSAYGQSVKDPKFFHKRLGAGDSAVYVPRLNSSLSGYDANGRADLVPRDTFALSSHTHVSADITDASVGGNTTADADLLAKYNIEGQLRGSVENSSTPAVWGSTAGTGYAGLFTGGAGTVQLSTPTVGVQAFGSNLMLDISRNNAGTAAHVGGLGGTGLDISNTGGMSWTNAAGITTTKTSLSLDNVENTAASTLYVPLTRTISTTLPLGGGGDLSANRTLTIANARANGSTLGAAAFTTNDFDDASGVISLDYTNGRAASTTLKGFLTDTDWNTFNNKQSAITFGTGVQTALGVNIGSAGAPVLINGAGGTPSSITLTNATGFPTLNQNTTGSAATLTTPRTISMTGDGTWTSGNFDGSTNVTGAMTLANSGVSAGTYSLVTVDAKGRVTAGANLNSSNVLSGDFTTSSATPVDITGWALTLADPGTYIVIIDCDYQSPNASTGVGVTMTITGSPSRRAFMRSEMTTATTQITDQLNNDDGGSVPTTVGGINTDRKVLFYGKVITDGSNCTVQMRAVRGGTSNTITIRTGASITAQKIQ